MRNAGLRSLAIVTLLPLPAGSNKIPTDRSTDPTASAPPQARLTPYRDALHIAGALRDLEIDGHRYVVADMGEGPTIVLLHGLGGSLYDWRFVQRPLSEQGFRVVAVDLLGAGESDRPADADYGIFRQARRVRGILDALGVARATLVGNSYGGGVALAFAQDWPERVERLVLLNSICYAENLPLYGYLCRLPHAPEGVVRILPLRRTAEWVLGGSYADPSRLTKEEVDQYVREIDAPGRRTTIVRTVRAIVPAGLDEFYARLREIRAPTLLLWGAKDTTVPVDFGRRLRDALPDARLVAFEDAAHVPNQERPERVLREIRSFMAEDSKTRADADPAHRRQRK